jgi:uncharacterized protein YidB (DUF937 family)
MGQYDDAGNQAVPGNDFVKPLMIAAGALILGHIFGGKKDSAAPAQQQLPPESAQAPDSGGGLGGLFGSLASSLGGLANSQLGGALSGAAAGTAVSGGLEALLNQFRQAGHTQAAESWVGTGDNHPISAEQINSVIGHGKIAEIAQQAGISPEQMSQLLAQALPSLIDKLTPGGHIKQG